MRRSLSDNCIFFMAVWALAVGVWLGAPTSETLAQVVKWDAPTSGSFHDAANWDTGVAPVISDTVAFDVAGTFDVDFFNDVAVNGLEITSGNITFNGNSSINFTVLGDATFDATVNNVGLPLSSNNGYVGRWGAGSLTLSDYFGSWSNRFDTHVGFQGNGVLNIQNNANLTTGRALVGVESGSIGEVNLERGQLSAAGSVEVGRWGAGTINMSNVSNLNVTNLRMGLHEDSSGVLSVDEGSFLTVVDNFSVGGNGTAVFEAKDRSFVVSRLSYIGSGAAGTGMATVDDASWRTSELFVGDNHAGHGTLNVSNGGYVSSSVATYVGRIGAATGYATVQHNGSRLSTNALWVGFAGHGTVDILDGGDIDANSIFLGWTEGFDGQVNIDGLGSSLRSPSTIGVGYGGTGTINISNRGYLNTTGAGVGWLTTGEGTVNIDGGTEGVAVWDNHAALYIGVNGTGRVRLTNGGLLRNSRTNGVGFIGLDQGAFGEVTVDGANSLWETNSEVYVGRGGTGELRIFNQGRVENTNGYVGDLVGSFGQATVSGTGSQWINNGYLRIGSLGEGEMHLLSGGMVSSESGAVGLANTAMGTVMIDGTGSEWVVAGQLQVGASGLGTLQVANGGQLNSTVSSIGTTSTGSGVVDLNGGNSRWLESAELTVGDAGIGELRVRNGAEVQASYGFIGRQTGSDGGALVQGGNAILNVAQDLFVGGDQATAGGAGHLEVGFEGTVQVGGELKVWNDGFVHLNGGTLEVNRLTVDPANFSFTFGELSADEVVGDLIQSGGRVSIGNSPGVMDVLGSYEMVHGNIEFEMGGYQPVLEFDVLNVLDEAVLNGTIEVALFGGFVPVLGDEFHLVNAGTISGNPNFDFTRAQLSPGLGWDTSLFLSQGTIAIISIPEPVSLVPLGIIGLVFLTRRSRTSRDRANPISGHSS